MSQRNTNTRRRPNTSVTIVTATTTTAPSAVTVADDEAEHWSPGDGQHLSGECEGIDVTSARTTPCRSPRDTHVAAVTDEVDCLFEEAEAARIPSTITVRVHPDQHPSHQSHQSEPSNGDSSMAHGAGTNQYREVGSAVPQVHATHESHLPNHDVDEESTRGIVEIEYDSEDRSPFSPYCPVSPLSMGRGDRYSLLNVHDHRADSATRSYSQLSRRPGPGGRSMASSGGNALRIVVSSTSVTPIGVGPASPVLSLQPSGAAAPRRSPPCTPVATRPPTTFLQRLRNTLIQRKDNPYPVAIGWDLVPTFLLAFTAMVILACFDMYLVQTHFSEDMTGFLPSFGASAAILFGLPKSPFAQPRNFFFGHIIGALLGVSAVQATRPMIEQEPLSDLVGGVWAVMAITGLMMYLNLLHPSSCATAIFAAQVTFLEDPNDRGYLFILTPVLMGCVTLFVVAWLGNNLFAARAPYPMYW